MKYYELKNEGTRILSEAGVENAEYDALQLLLHAAELSKVQYSVGQRDEAAEEEVKKYFNLIERRKMHEPLQYLIGNTGFMGYTFFCEEGVLIPRYDTEVLVDYALRKAPKDSLKVLDLCTGSGCIGISFYLERKRKGVTDAVTLADISDKALALSKKNAEELHAEVSFRKTDMYSGLQGEKYDIILSNPPYIPTKVIETLSEEVKDHEPILALDGDSDGLKFYREIIQGAKEHLLDKGCIFFEIGHDQGEAVKQMLLLNGFRNVSVVKDLAGMDRVVHGELQ